jgi:hypothetical protein
MRQVRRLAVAGLVLSAGLGGVRAVSPDTAPRVRVRWDMNVSNEQRTNLERQFRLLASEHVEETTWAYDLADPSPAAVMALVQHPAVADTHAIDRSTGTIDGDAPRGTVRLGSYPLGEWVESRAATWVLVWSVWTSVLSGAWLAFSGRNATP